jgi:hypothetical protein
MKRDIRKLSRLIVQLMDIQEGDREAKRRWEQRVREAYPYEQMILTAKLGEIVDLNGMCPLQQMRTVGGAGRGR